MSRHEDSTPERASTNPTALGVYCECLAIIETLPPHERKPVAEALASFAQWCPAVLADCTPDWRATAAKWSKENRALIDRIDELEAELDEVAEREEPPDDERERAAWNDGFTEALAEYNEDPR